MDVRYLMIFLLASAVSGDEETGEENDPVTITYQCDPTELLILYNRSDSEVRMHCSPPPMCGNEKTCISTIAPACEAKSQYLSGVLEQPDGNIVSSCCQITPPIDGDEPCYEITITDQSHQGGEGGMFLMQATPKPVPPPAAAVPRPQPGIATRVPRPPAQPSPPSASPPGSAHPRPFVPRTFLDKVDLMLFDLYDRRPPIELVKGVYRTPNGYRIKICKPNPNCRSTTSTTSTVTVTTRIPITSTARITTDKVKPTKAQDDEHASPPNVPHLVGNGGATGIAGTGGAGGAGGDVTIRDGQRIRTVGGDFCRSGGEIECQAKCREISGASLISGACKSSSGSSNPTGSGGVTGNNGNSVPQVCVCIERVEPSPNPDLEAAAPANAHRGIFANKLGTGHGCFSGDMVVETPSGPRRMDQLHIGDKVMVLTAESDEKYQPIEWFYHRDINHLIEFITLKTESGRTLSLTPNHLIPLFSCSNSRYSLQDIDQIVVAASFFASRSKVGLCVATVSGDEFLADRIIEVSRERRRGIFSPITSSGTIVVNRIQTSCYSSLENQAIQRSIHSVLIRAKRIAQSILYWLSGVPENMEDKDIPTVLAVLLQLAKNVLPTHVYV